MDGIIDIIVLILIGVVPAVFKAIGNKLEKSGKAEKAGRFKKISEAFEDEDGESALEGWLLEKMDKEDRPAEPVALDPAPVVMMRPAAPKPMAEDVVSQIKTTKRPEAIRPTNRKPIMLIEDEPEKKGEKIDPKKMVIYSEIMKPKF